MNFTPHILGFSVNYVPQKHLAEYCLLNSYIKHYTGILPQMIDQVVFSSIHIFPTQQNTNPIFPYLRLRRIVSGKIHLAAAVCSCQTGLFLCNSKFHRILCHTKIPQSNISVTLGDFIFYSLFFTVFRRILILKCILIHCKICLLSSLQLF